MQLNFKSAYLTMKDSNRFQIFERWYQEIQLLHMNTLVGMIQEFYRS